MPGPWRSAAGLALLLALAAAGAALTLRPLAQGPALHARLTADARRVLGREVELGAVGLGLLPPRLVVHDVRVLAGAPGAAPLAEADSAVLPLALLPLLRRELVVGSVRLQDARVRLQDPGVSPPVRLELEGLRLRARPDARDGVVEFELSARVVGGGSLAAQGSFAPAAALAAQLTLEGVSSAPILAYVAELRALAGEVSGTLRASGPLAEPALIADLELAQGAVELPQLRLDGRLGLRAELDGWPPRAGGRFAIDASAAELAWEGAYHKPAGTPASAEGRLVPGASGRYGVAGLRVRLRDFEAQLRPRHASRDALATEPRP